MHISPQWDIMISFPTKITPDDVSYHYNDTLTLILIMTDYYFSGHNSGHFGIIYSLTNHKSDSYIAILGDFTWVLDNLPPSLWMDRYGQLSYGWLYVYNFLI